MFFDAADIKYLYEPEGFEVGLGEYDGEQTVIRYLPDFYLPDFGVYCEVKPSREKLLEDAEKLAWMIDYGGPMSNGLLILGQIPFVNEGEFPTFVLYSCDEGIHGELVTISANGIITSSFDLLGNSLKYDYCSAPDFDYPNGRGKTWDDLCVVRHDFPTLHRDGTVWRLDKKEIPCNAYSKARQARFEFNR